MPRIGPIFTLVCAGCLAPGVPPALAAFPGDNGRILFGSDRHGGDDDIWTMNPQGRKLANLTVGSKATDSFANWRADGRRIVFMSDRETPRNPDPRGSRGPDFEIFVMHADGSKPKQLTFNEFDDEDPAWSPDGSRIVFARDFNRVRGKFRYDILTMNADGTAEKNLTDSPGDDLQPNWSSDRRIVFTSFRDGDGEIFTMSSDGSNVRRLTSNAFDDEFPNWSPDGKTIAFNRTRKGNFDIYTMRARGRSVRRLTVDAAGEAFPAWSPDGRALIFASDRDGSPDVFTMRADGRDQVNRTTNKAFDFAPDWQPVRRR